MEENFRSLIKGFYKEPTTDILLNGERVKAFPLRSEKRQDVHSSLLFNIVPEVLAREIRLENEIKSKIREE